MSKARLVITAVITGKRPVSEVARDYGVARSWVYAPVTGPIVLEAFRASCVIYGVPASTLTDIQDG